MSLILLCVECEWSMDGNGLAWIDRIKIGMEWDRGYCSWSFLVD